MRKFALILLFTVVLVKILPAQESRIKIFPDFGIGIANMLGKGAYHNSYMIGTIPIENDYTQNPYGKKIKTYLTAGVMLQYALKKNSGLLAMLEFHQPGGKVNLNGVTYPLSATIVRPASGKTIIDIDAVGFSVSAYKKFDGRSIPYLYAGLCYSYVFNVNENGKAIDYTITGEFVSKKNQSEKDFLQLQTGLWYDVGRFRVSCQYRIAIVPFKNPVLNDGSNIFPQSLAFKLAYAISL